jgi:hypothetical protein
MLADNYKTITTVDYQAAQLPNGFEELPVRVQDQRTAFTQGAYNHNPRLEQVYDLFTDAKIRAPFDILPRDKPRLFGVHNHDPLTKENHGYVIFFFFHFYIFKNNFFFKLNNKHRVPSS